MKVSSVSHVLPGREVTNKDVIGSIRRECRGLAADDLETLVQLTEAGFHTAGTEVRYQLAAGETAFGLCAAAGRDALARAGLAPGDIDLVLYASIGRGFIEPATANVFQDLLGLCNATCFDVVDACASWVRAMEVACRFLASGGRYRHVMILNAEFISRYAYRYDLTSLDEFEHWFPGVTLGEAAAATIVSRDDHDATPNFAFDFRTWGEKRSLCMIPLENYEDYLGQATPHGRALAPLRFASFGGHILHFGAEKLAAHFREAADFNTPDYDIVFGHAASDGASRMIGEMTGVDLARFEYTHGLYGNTASASIPLAMSVAERAGRLQRGDRALVMFASAGVSTALMRFTY